MSITPNQCRAARGLFAMSRQELANASGVSLRTISSFEDASERLPTAANLSAIQAALQHLGVVFEDGGIQWSTPFSEAQTNVIIALAVRNGPNMVSAAELLSETGCSRADIEFLAQLKIIIEVDGYPVLTAIGLHFPGLLRDHESRQRARRIIGAATNYTVRLDDRTVFHAQTATVFRIEDNGTLKTLFDKHLPPEFHDAVVAGAREALRLHRERNAKGTWG